MTAGSFRSTNEFEGERRRVRISVSALGRRSCGTGGNKRQLHTPNIGVDSSSAGVPAVPARCWLSGRSPQSGGAEAKTLAYCLEANPSTLSPALAISGTDMNASARSDVQYPDPNPPRTDTDLEPSLANIVDGRGRRTDLHVQSAQGRDDSIQRKHLRRPALSTPTTSCFRSNGNFGQRNIPFTRVARGRYTHFDVLGYPRRQSKASKSWTTSHGSLPPFGAKRTVSRLCQPRLHGHLFGGVRRSPHGRRNARKARPATRGHGPLPTDPIPE